MIWISPYNDRMSAHVIGNPVPTPEEMGKILGLTPEHVAAVRRIMSTPSSRKTSKGASRAGFTRLRKKDRSETSSKVRGKQ
jgi:hypothetical protein